MTLPMPPALLSILWTVLPLAALMLIVFALPVLIPSIRPAMRLRTLFHEAVLIAFIAPAMLGCFLKPAARTANDLARATCETFADARERQLGMSAEQWCGLHANLDPFLQTILAAERRAGIANSYRPPPDESHDEPPTP